MMLLTMFFLESLGDCSFLNTCFHMETCKYVHYQIDYPSNHSSRTKTDNFWRKRMHRKAPPSYIRLRYARSCCLWCCRFRKIAFRYVHAISLTKIKCFLKRILFALVLYSFICAITFQGSLPATGPHHHHLQSVAWTNRHPALSKGTSRQCETSSGSRPQ